MEMKVMRCPGCGSELEIENGIDIFYCKYCGNKIVLEQSDEAIKAKTRAKMVNDISDRVNEFARERRAYKDRKQKENDKRFWFGMAMVAIWPLILYIIMKIVF